jgi:hypothetical protein
MNNEKSLNLAEKKLSSSVVFLGSRKESFLKHSLLQV